jgi:hypothetical protein
VSFVLTAGRWGQKTLTDNGLIQCYQEDRENWRGRKKARRAKWAEGSRSKPQLSRRQRSERLTHGRAYTSEEEKREDHISQLRRRYDEKKKSQTEEEAAETHNTQTSFHPVKIFEVAPSSPEPAPSPSVRLSPSEDA